MGLNVYYPQDVRNALQAAEQSTNAALTAVGGDDAYTRGYREGYRAALTTVALAFGLLPNSPPVPAPTEVGKRGELEGGLVRRT